MTAGTITALRVLLVEDDLADAALVERTLLRGGYKALVCRVHTATALRRALAARMWDLVLVDAGAHDDLLKDQLARLGPAVEHVRDEAPAGIHQRLAERECEQLLAAEQVARAEAEAALDLRDTFLATAAHELKTPVSVLRASVQVLMRQLGTLESDELGRLTARLETLDQQTGKLTRLLSQLLDIAGLDAGKLVLERQLTDMAQLVWSVVATYAFRAEQPTLNVYAPAAVRVWVDPVRFEQVPRNLLDNAIKFSPVGMPIDLLVSTLDANTARVAVRDRGAGIPQERRADIFERYHQAPNAAQHAGIGLGLYISRQIVEAHGGRLEVEFPTDGGTRFVATVPVGDPTHGEHGSTQSAACPV